MIPTNDHRTPIQRPTRANHEAATSTQCSRRTCTSTSRRFKISHVLTAALLLPTTVSSLSLRPWLGGKTRRTYRTSGNRIRSPLYSPLFSSTSSNEVKTNPTMAQLQAENERLRTELEFYKTAAMPFEPQMDHSRPLMGAMMKSIATGGHPLMGAQMAMMGSIAAGGEEYNNNAQEQSSFDDQELEMPEEEDLSFSKSLADRAGWLVGLLILQSLSGFILGRNEDLLQQHVVIIRFLTMLVGAGGNAGNQASVRVIRGLAVGSITEKNASTFFKRELGVGLCLSLILGVVGCVRAAVFHTPVLETVAITASLTMIVMISIVLGALLPMFMKRIGIDPAHSSTTIQVIMDILGVLLTVRVSQLVLESGFTSKILEWIS